MATISMGLDMQAIDLKNYVMNVKALNDSNSYISTLEAVTSMIITSTKSVERTNAGL